MKILIIEGDVKGQLRGHMDQDPCHGPWQHGFWLMKQFIAK